MRLVAILSVFSLVALGQDSRELMNQGIEAYKRAKYVDAVNAFQKAVDLNPSDVNARLYLVHLEANAFIAALKRMSEEEKSLVYEVLELGCPGHLPKAIHISLDLLHRSTGYAVAKVLRTLGGMESIGFHCKVEEMAKGDHHRKSQSERIVKLGFTVNTVEFTRLTAKQYSTDIVSTIHDVLREDRCEDCVREAFSRGDSSQLSSATATPERHTASRRRRGRSRATKDAKDRRNKK